MAQFMHVALAHPEHGYYKSREPFGAQGDFTTAPEISQMFGELVGVWCVDLWYKMGSPDDLQIVEIGPGRGTLMDDLLRITRHIPSFHDSISISMVETSKRLSDVQREKISHWHKRIEWLEDFNNVPQKPLVVICNELFDALPVHQYVKQNGVWHEKMLVVNEAGELEFMLSQTVFTPESDGAKDGAVIEVCPQAPALMAEICGRIKQHGGAALVIDYGYAQPVYKNTIMALGKHKHHEILEDIGKVDISAHVDFQVLGRVAVAAGLDVYGVAGQGDFLRALGIELRAEKLMEKATEKQKSDIKSAMDRLIGNSKIQMGELFKVLAVTSEGLVPEGF